MNEIYENPDFESGAEESIEEEDVTYGDIVWGQFKKNRVAYISLWGVAGLFILATFAPLLSSAEPFYWKDASGTSYPWFTTLFDTNYFENSVDIFFNLLMVLGMPMLLAWWLWMRSLHKKIRDKRPRRRLIKAVFFAGVMFFLFFFTGMVKTYVGIGSDAPNLVLKALDFGFMSYLVYGVCAACLFLHATGRELLSRRVTLAILAGYLCGNALHVSASPYRVSSKLYWANQAEIAAAQADVDTTKAALSLLEGADAAQPEKKAQLQEALKTQEEALAGIDKIEAFFPLAPYSYRQQDFPSLDKPTKSHVFGISKNGSDVATRILYGTRISLTIGFIAVAIYVTIGIILGSLAGYFGGKVDIMIQRLIEIVMCIPSFFLILTVIAMVGSASIFLIMCAIGFVRWTGVARLVRGEFLRLRNQDFVTSAKALGYPTRRIIFQHVLPNALGPVLVAAAFGVAQAILLESSLSFLGMGDASTASWGVTLREGHGAEGAWHLVLIPGAAIFLTVLLLNLAGEGVRDAMDPKLRK